MLDFIKRETSTHTSKKHPKLAKTTTLNEWVLTIESTIAKRILGKFYLINSPWGFSTVWSIIKRWLDPVTVSKIAILGSNYQESLLKQIPAENLPSQFGGKCRCPGGCELSDEGPWQDPQWLGPQEQKSAAAAETTECVGKHEEASTSSGSTEPSIITAAAAGEALPAA